MNITRILFLAKYRVPHACLSLQFDYFLKNLTRTIIATPLSQDELWPIFDRYNIDTSRFECVNDSLIYQLYPEVNNWVFAGDYRGWWLRQQAIKLAYLDYLDYEIALMHDPDTFMVEPYCCWQNGCMNMLVLPNTTHGSYDQVLPAVLSMPRQTPHCFVTELVPVHKGDFANLRSTLESQYRSKFLDAIIDHVPTMPTVAPWGEGNQIHWFSEYEFLGNWTLTQRKVSFQFQSRFEYDCLDKLNQFDATKHNCFADAVPDLSNSLQLDWDTGVINNFGRYLSIIQSCLSS